jgi:hypothetical protein
MEGSDGGGGVAQYCERAHDRGFLCKIFLFTKPSLLDAYMHCVYTAKTQYRKFETNIPRKGTARLYGPNSYIHISGSDFYIPLIGLPILLQENR